MGWIWFFVWLNAILAVGGFITDVIIPAVEKKMNKEDTK